MIDLANLKKYQNEIDLKIYENETMKNHQLDKMSESKQLQSLFQSNSNINKFIDEINLNNQKLSNECQSIKKTILELEYQVRIKILRSNFKILNSLMI